MKAAVQSKSKSQRRLGIASEDASLAMLFVAWQSQTSRNKVQRQMSPLPRMTNVHTPWPTNFNTICFHHRLTAMQTHAKTWSTTATQAALISFFLHRSICSIAHKVSQKEFAAVLHNLRGFCPQNTSQKCSDNQTSQCQKHQKPSVSNQVSQAKMILFHNGSRQQAWATKCSDYKIKNAGRQVAC